jgi:hypothetical protein
MLVASSSKWLKITAIIQDDNKSQTSLTGKCDETLEKNVN